MVSYENFKQRFLNALEGIFAYGCMNFSPRISPMAVTFPQGGVIQSVGQGIGNFAWSIPYKYIYIYT